MLDPVVAKYDPITQPTQTVAPFAVWYWPEAQLKQSASWSCKPALVAASAKKVPAGHVAQVDDNVAPVAAE